MGDCIYCRRPAGLFRRRHAACRAKHDDALAQIPAFFVKALDSKVKPERFRALAAEVARTHHVSEQELATLAGQGVADMIDRALADHVLTADEDQRIVALADAFGLHITELPDRAGHRLGQAAVLRELDAGRVPRLGIEAPEGINLGRGEGLVWLFAPATYFQTRQRRTYRGGSHGVSLRIMQGVYYRVGAFKGEPVDTRHQTEEGTGMLVLSTAALYFVSPTRSVKIPYRKIVSAQGHADGITVTRDAANALPQIFIIDDAWFAANAIARLSQI